MRDLTRSSDAAQTWLRLESERESADARSRTVLFVILFQLSPLFLWWIL